ncbi:MAG TPA: hypothetical protein LFV91_02525 [Rickettsia endosymbiont of Bembidion nr. Transversale]|nr:hypothetical protein [Rickettsia endosymbiont of Bembidion nr. Transversale]
MERKRMNNKKSNQAEKSILRGMQETVLYSKGKLKGIKAKKHNISLPDVDVIYKKNRNRSFYL